jgi:hypothetical protein
MRRPCAGCPGFPAQIRLPQSDRCKFLASRKERGQIRGVRGSPLIRFILLALALAVTGAGLARVTATRKSIAPPPAVVTDTPALPGMPVPFRLLLSDPAAVVEIDTGKLIRPPADSATISGTLELDPKNPRVGLVVRWKNAAAPGEHRFVKLTLEAPGQDTFTHVFDAGGDIDDFLELPFPAAE